MIKQKKQNMIIKNNKSIDVCALVTAICLLADSMLYVALPIYFRDVGLQSMWEVGLILSLNRLVRIPLNPFVSFIYARIQLRTGFLISVVLAIVTTVGYGVFQGLLYWILLRIVWGLAWSFFRLGGFFLILDTATNENRGELMGRYNGLYRLGSLGGMVVGGICVSLTSLSFTALLFASVMIVSIPLTLIYIPVKQRENAESVIEMKQIENSIVTKPVLLAITSGMLLAFIIQGLFASTISLVMFEHFTEEVFLFGVSIGVAAVSGVLQGIRWVWEPFLAVKVGKWSDGKYGRFPLFISFLVFGSLGFILIPLHTPFFVFVFIVVLTMVCSTALTTLVDAITTDIAKTYNQHRVITWYTIFLDTGASLGPLIVYILLEFGAGIPSVYAIAWLMMLMIASGWGLYIYNKNEKRLQDNSA
ncbi:MFS transporter [Alkalihalobacterium bogoriense]|uniref:MFS transporter n=1 Tax=Alkalihalobacterium bogoriense TaxID=246272 RepID=UPI000685B2CE|nr:MFS transporter [Alkalihalobacterium bogoriense]